MGLVYLKMLLMKVEKVVILFCINFVMGMLIMRKMPWMSLLLI